MNAKPVFDSISPFFPVEDVSRATEFYCKSLGFDVGWIWGEPPTHANVCRDRIGISFSSQSAADGSGNIYINMSGVDVYYAELKAKRVNVGPLADRDYGMRDFLVVDPWGNRLVFGEPLPT